MKPTSLRERDFKRILLIKPSAFGDVLHAIPVLVKLRARYPDARIDWLVTPENAEVVRHHPALSKVVLFPRRNLRPLALLGLFRKLWRTRYDLVIDLHGQFRCALFTLATGAPVRIGFDRPQRALARADSVTRPKEAYRHCWTGAREGAWIAYTHRIPIPTLEVHAVERYLWIAPMLGLDELAPDFTVHFATAAMSQADRLLADAGVLRLPLAILVPGTVWPTKHWRVEGFAAVGRYLQQTGHAVLIVGSNADRACCRAVAEACPDAIDLSGRTSLAELAALVQRAAICITNDSGAMHLAVALGRPVVSIFGPTDPVWVGPYGRPQAVVRANLPCSPCYLRKLSDCPQEHACMHEVTADAVIQRVAAVLGNRAATAA